MGLQITTYIPKSKPYVHQAEGFRLSERAKAFYYACDPRTGKTKLTLDVACAAFERGTIDGLLIAAPKGVDLNWVTDEIPPHMPDRIKRMCLVFRSGKCNSQVWKRQFAELLAFKGLAVLAMNHEAFATVNGRAVAERFLRKRRALFALDEAAAIKTPGTARTRAITRLGKFAVARRALDGTPNAESPLELFAQYRFLDPNILGFTNYTVFKARYAVQEQGYDRRSGKTYNKVVGYAHVEELQAKIAPYTYRVRREDVFDMPAKVYQKIPYQLSDEQRRVYNALKEEYRAELKSGEVITVTNVLSRYLRLQQVLSNKMPSARIMLCVACTGEGCDICGDSGVIDEETEPAIIDLNSNPRLDAARVALEENKHLPTMVWTRFRSEAKDLISLASDLGRKCCRYDGSVSDRDKEAAKQGFKAGDFDLFVGSAAAAGRGLTFAVGPKGRLMIYYSNYHRLRLRIQSEDRMEAPTHTQGTGILDICAEDTVDFTIIDALRNKKSVSDMIQGDPSREWI